ncbi:FxSxx-COOH system tetratricopeptide repeat protein [Dactylosporangium sp. NPDC049525]|uniref:FxSxx-COOH system tetratricopeptide repeat protein n=1 Tax=Dactylosporangium sp. NPDC049525 TaxID=3154730 RepID=UPI00341586D2
MDSEDMRLEDLAALRDALDAMPELGHTDTWRKILGQLKKENPALSPDRFTPDFNTFDILSTCVGAEQGLGRLAIAIRIVLGRSEPVLAFNDLVTKLSTRESAATPSEHLDALLREVPLEAHAAAVGHEAIAVHAALLAGAQDALEAFRRLDGATPEVGSLYLELIGHQLDQRQATLIHKAIDQRLSLAPGLRVAVDELHSSFAAGVRREQNTSVQDTSRQGRERPADGDKMITVTVTDADRAASTKQSTTWGGVPPRNNNFAGRKDLLTQIHDARQSASSPSLLLQALHGLGGVGKTNLAIEYAYQFQEDYDLVWWVPADEERLIRRSLVSLARRLGLPESADADDTIGAVLDGLRRGQPHERWLLIFDNAGDPEAIQNYRPRAGHGHVLVTSRSNRWPGYADTISVDVFTEDESVEMFGKRWKGLTEAEARSLGTRLGHLPLALEQAAAVHNETGMSLQEYLTALGETPYRVLAEGTPAGYPNSLADTFRVAYRELRNKSEAAAQLFGVCAMMSTQPISVAVLIRGRGGQLPAPLSTELRTEMTRRNAIRDMGSHALAQFDAGRNFIKIHNLVGDLLREELGDEERAVLTKAAHSILALANPGEPDNLQNWPALAQINPHVVPSGILSSDDAEERTVFLDQIRYLYAVGDYAASRALGELAVNEWTRTLGSDDVMAMVASRHLANSLREQGEHTTVVQLNQDTLGRMRRTLGERHEHTLATANSVGADHRLQGRFNEALALDTENWAAYRATLGDDDPATLRSANNLAVDLRLMGRFKEAYELDIDIVRRQAAMFGDDSIQTFYANGSVARDLLGLGRYADALAQQKRILRIHEHDMRPGHRDLLRARRAEAVLMRRNGYNAIEVAEVAYHAHKTHLGETHEQTFAATLTLANTCRVAGDQPRAYELGQAALDAYTVNLGGRHPLTLAAMVNVAIILRHLTRLDEAMAMNDDALKGLKSTVGEDHQWALCALANGSNILASRGHTEEAQERSAESLSRSRRVRGADHPYTLACAINNALDLESIGADVEAAALRRDAIARMRHTLYDRHPDVIDAGLGSRADCDIESPSI